MLWVYRANQINTNYMNQNHNSYPVSVTTKAVYMNQNFNYIQHLL
jgi:hypothetical protein